MSAAPSIIRPRAGQVEFERGVDRHRIAGLVARRQYGKTTLAARIALKKMMRTAGHSVVFGSVKLDLGREIVRKESAEIHAATRQLAQLAGAAKLKLDLVDEKDGRDVMGLPDYDFADLYEASRLEFRLYHSRTVYSRTKVVALTPDAVGETGDLILDEVGRVKKFREVWEAVKPIISSNPQFRCLLTTTPPPDDTHYSFELLAPPIGADFPVSPCGNWYRSELGVWILRVTAYDAAADGVLMYDDDQGEAITPEESRRRDHDKDAWDRNYGCKFIVGGTAACGLVLLDTAQQRGIGNCRCFVIEDDADYDAALKWLAQNLAKNKVGLGVDWATTEGGVSNPTAVAVAEQEGAHFIIRAVFVWKTADPDLATDRLTRIVRTVNERPAGGRARRLCQDATNEKYHCVNIRKKLRALVPVENVVSSETIERPGGEKVTLKQWLGSQYVGELEDNHLTLPPERYLREDHRLPKKSKGTFACEPDAQGRHGDTFDACKLAVNALLRKGYEGPVKPCAVGTPQGSTA